MTTENNKRVVVRGKHPVRYTLYFNFELLRLWQVSYSHSPRALDWGRQLQTFTSNPIRRNDERGGGERDEVRKGERWRGRGRERERGGGERERERERGGERGERR